jgi:hypothetical protein
VEFRQCHSGLPPFFALFLLGDPEHHGSRSWRLNRSTKAAFAGIVEIGDFVNITAPPSNGVLSVALCTRKGALLGETKHRADKQSD